ncbi:peptidase family S66 [Xylariales sp. PMI_506]|nr:peptidase family S66 [Xylariales sp. PMI_506]
MPSVIVPKALEPGATIAFVSPSARLVEVVPDVVARGKALLERRGYQVRNIFHKDTGTQSGITNRLAELRTAFSDPTISAIFCTIGGATFTELLPHLIADTELHGIIRANPKIVVGYSDITGLHWFLHALTGLRTFYGPGIIPELGEAVASEDDETTARSFCVRHLFRAIGPAGREAVGEVARSPTYAPRLPSFFTNPSSTEPLSLAPTSGWQWIRGGRAQGRLFGGCLTVMARLGGVRPIAPDWRGRVVFLETAIGEDRVSGNPLARVKAGIADLIAHGVFEEAAGLVVGRPFGYDTPELKEQYTDTIKDLLCEGRLAERKFPILFNVDFGHTTPFFTLPYDTLVELDSEKDSFSILEPAVL